MTLAGGSVRPVTWLLLITGVVGLGCLQVAQRTALFLKGYAVGERMSRAHAQAADVSWLETTVVGLSSPVHLADVARERQMTFIAWSTLDAVPSPQSLPRIASIQPETSD